MKVSVIIPCFNAVDKIGRCLASLRAIDMPRQEYEVLFIDDCSTDGTFALLEDECAKESNWRAEQLPTNSGSPSRPRNRGLELARGEYVFFLDCDDEISSDTLRLHYKHALASNADIVRGYLFVNDGRKSITMNRMTDWSDALSREERIAKIVKDQSMGSTNLFRTELLRKNKLAWQEDIRMGEDTLYLAHALVIAKKIEYIDHPAITYNKYPSLLASTTQSFGAKELRDHLIMWPSLAKILSKAGVDYYRLRFKVSLRYILSLLVQRNRGDIGKELFREYSEFISGIWSVVRKFDYPDRYAEIINSLHANDFNSFRHLCRPRLLIAGHDLKFVASALPELEHYFDVRFDEWSGHSQHDEGKSLELLGWAELIWCEWLLGNAVWYSERKKPTQKLVIRMHRFEVGHDYGSKLCVENVDSIITVATLFFERLLERFPNIPREKVRLVPIGYSLEKYNSTFSKERLKTIAMIGILPSGKGLHKAIRILADLRKKDPEFRLEIFGKTPEELSWIANDKSERDYFNECQKAIKYNKLENSIRFNGHSDITTSLAQRKVGYVLSLSSRVRELPGFEAFHVAVGDGYAGGAVSLILHYHGAEYVWPEEFILPTTEAIVERILSFQDDPKKFQLASQSGRTLIKDRYQVEDFASTVKEIFSQ